MTKPSKKEQELSIQKEVDRLNAVFMDLPDNKREVARELIERVAFMTIQLEILEETIKTMGPTYMFTQGSQKMLIENPAQKSYNTTMNRYTTAYDKLLNLVDKLPPKMMNVEQVKDESYEDI